MYKCAIPVFDGLLPEPHNSVLIKLLFLCTHWHGLAKLRLHTELTLGIMDRLTTELGQAFRRFENEVCSAYMTHELPQEAAAREKREQAQDTASQNQPGSASAGTVTKREPKRLGKSLNLQTYKHHSLGDYVDTIRKFGTTDSYNTELVRRFPCGTIFLFTF